MKQKPQRPKKIRSGLPSPAYEENYDRIFKYSDVYTVDYFNSRPNLDDDLNRGHFFEYASWLVRTFDFNTVIDVGCGHGNMICNLDNLGKSVTGLDISQHILDVVKNKCPRAFTIKDEMPELKKMVGRTWDIVVCYQVLEHLTEEDALLAISNMHKSAGKHLILSICTDLVKGAEDKTHILLRPREWWLDKLHEYKIIDNISYNNSPEEFIILGGSI